MNLSTTTRPARILAVFAHPDDETLCAGGTLARYAAQGAEIMVVSATRGDAGQIHDAASATRRTLGLIRERELGLACQRLGVRHAVCLDYGDGTLARLEPTILTRHITRIVRQFRPNIVITFGPDGAYGHPDHVAIGAATSSACGLAGDATAYPEQLVAGLEPHEPQALYHCHFPRHRLLLRDLLAAWLAVHKPDFKASSDSIKALPLLARELSVLGCTGDHVEVQWYADGFSVVEQGEAASKLYLILDGTAEVIHEDSAGKLLTSAQLEAGAFFGQQDLALAQPSGAHIIARGSLTCMVLSPGAPTAFAGRGTNGEYAFDAPGGAGEGHAGLPGQSALHSQATTSIDVAAYIEHKIAALAAHRTQCPVTPDMLPPAIFSAVLGREYFVRVHPTPRLESELLPRAWAGPIPMLAARQPALLAA